MNARLSTVLAAMLSVLGAGATPAVTTTWTSATTSFDYKDEGSRTDNYVWWNGNWSGSSHSWATVWSKAVTPSTFLYSGHVWDDMFWFGRFCGSCSSHSYRSDWWDNMTAVSAAPALPQTQELSEGGSGGPADLWVTHIGTWTARYRYIEDGVIQTDETHTYHNAEWLNILYASRGADTYSASAHTVFQSEPGDDPQHTGYESWNHQEQLSCSLACQASYCGPENTQALLNWSLYPWSYFDNVTSGGTGRASLLNPGDIAGPGGQASWPLERVWVEFTQVVQ